MTLDLVRFLHGIKERPLALQWLGHCPLLASAGQGLVIRIHHSNGELLQSFSAHTDRICCLKWLPEQNKLASGSFDRTLKIWDIEVGKMLQSFRCSRDVYALEWMRCANQLAAGSEDLRFYDIRLRRQSACINTLLDPAVSLKWSNENQCLASGSIGNTITLWDIVARAPIQVLYGHTDFVKDLEWIDDIRVLASGSRDGSLKLWDLENSKSYFSKELGRGSTAICNLSGSNKLVSAGNDRQVNLWSLQTASVVQSFSSSEGEVTTMSWNPDEQMLAAASYFHIGLYTLAGC